MRVLLVEDDTMIGEEVQIALQREAHAVDWVKDADRALLAMAAHGYDLVLLDLGLPGRDGHELLRDIRRQDAQIPVIIVTARDAVENRIEGLDGGADDYVLKPFEAAELLARMRAVSRRRAGTALPVLSNGDITLELATRQVIRHGECITLTAREYALLHALLVRPGAILSRQMLEERIYGWNEEVESNAVEYLIHHLRRKLGATAIRNVRGSGWMVAKGE